MRGRRGRGRGRGRNISRRQLHNTICGHTIRTPFDPPNYVDKPWNTVTVVLGATGDKQVNVTMIHPTVLTQLGLDEIKTTTFEYRFHKARVWAQSVSRPIRCSFFGSSAASSGGAQAYGIVTDWGAPNRQPHVGWEWPAAIKQVTWISTSKDLVFAVDVGKTPAGDDIPWLCYLDINWRSSKYNPISLTPRAIFAYDPTYGDSASALSGSSFSFPSTSSYETLV